MPKLIEIDQLLKILQQLPEAVLIGIDGLPCSGKSTLADRISLELGYDCIYLDDFILPEEKWPSKNIPAFPFEYIRYQDFIDAVTQLYRNRECTYYPFDWESVKISDTPKIVKLERPVMIEGLSSLNPVLNIMYGVRVFVDSDRNSILEAVKARGIGPWAAEWKSLFLPSADIYMESCPKERADFIVRGRGFVPLQP